MLKISDHRVFTATLIGLMGVFLSVFASVAQAQFRSTYVENPKARQNCGTVIYDRGQGYDRIEYRVVDKLSDGTRVATNPAHLQRVLNSINGLQPYSTMGVDEFRDPMFGYASVSRNELHHRFVAVLECFIKYAKAAGPPSTKPVAPKTPPQTQPKMNQQTDSVAVSSIVTAAPDSKSGKVVTELAKGDLTHQELEDFSKKLLTDAILHEKNPEFQGRQKLILRQYSECLQAVDIQQDKTIKTMYWYTIKNKCQQPLIAYWCDGEGCSPVNKADFLLGGGKVRNWMDVRKSGKVGFKGTACQQTYQGRRVYYDFEKNQCWLWDEP